MSLVCPKTPFRPRAGVTELNHGNQNQIAAADCRRELSDPALCVTESYDTSRECIFTTISIPDLHPTFSPFICISRHILSAYDSAHEGRQPHEWI